MSVEHLTCPEDLARLRLQSARQTAEDTVTIAVCMDTCCCAKGAEDVWSAFETAIGIAAERGLHIELKRTACHGLCERGPLVIIAPGDILYQNVKPENVTQIVEETVVGGRVLESLIYEDPETGKKTASPSEIPFYTKQMRLVLRHNGAIDPESIDDYVAVGGYDALAKVLTEMTPEQVIAEVETSGLRGRGGGGFPTARKWRSCRAAEGSPRYIICNGDEGDPGAFMDRSIMEANPHAVIEGMIIGAYAIGSPQGFVYVRNEYPLAVRRVRKAIEDAHEHGLLGDNILGTGFDLDITINRGAGAFVCGESTALMASLEGHPGEPRAKYVHTVEVGLHGKPTCLNNVETWANVPAIISRGGKWFASIGTEGSKGTKVFSLAGKIRNTGLVEVPMGMTLREIVCGIGGGIPDGKRLKAVQTGGPSGGCIPEHLLDTPVDFDQLYDLGSMMGSGGLIVMDEDTCMVNVARYFLTFLREESCGKCTACREGTAQMCDILNRICAGEGREGDVELLLDLCQILEDAALCALGTSAANPVRSTTRYFRDEYDQHIRDHYCPAHDCRGLFSYEIVVEECRGCGACLKECPVEAISGEKRKPHALDQSLCVRCGACFDACSFSAIARVKPRVGSIASAAVQVEGS